MLVTPRRATVALIAALCTLGLLGTPASAAVAVAADAQTATREITFPVAGPNTYTDTFGACRSGCSRSHQGTDIMAGKLTPAVAARDGVVTGLKATATPDGAQGNYLMIRDAEGWEYWYIHVNNDSPGTNDGTNPEQWMFGPGIEKGAKVTAGQLVAYVGDSGNAEGIAPQLHFEIHKPDGSVINPYASLSRATETGQPSSGADARTSAGDEAFAKALARDFLDRPADPSEVTRVVDRLASGADRSTVVQGYAGSDEWISALVGRYYQSTLDRAPDPGGLRYWIDQIRRGMTPAAVASRFYASDEYFQRAGSDPRAWVTDLYQEILLRSPDADGLAHWAGLAARGVSRTTIAGDFYGSLESRRTRVTGLYEALLDRRPDATGLVHWSDRLTNGRDIELAVLLASSPEYYQLAAKGA